MPPPLPLPLFRICISDCRRYFPSNGTLDASPTTPQPPSASCLTNEASGTGNDLRESIIAWPVIAISLVSYQYVFPASKLTDAPESELGENDSQTFRPGVEQVDNPLLSPLGINELGKLWISCRYADLAASSPFTVPTMSTSNRHSLRCTDYTTISSQRNRLRHIVRSPDPTARHQRDLVPDPFGNEILVNLRNRILDRHGNILLRNLRRRTGPAVAAVNVDDVRASIVAPDSHHVHISWRRDLH